MITGGGPGGVTTPISANIWAGTTYGLKISNSSGEPITFYYGENHSGDTTWLVYTLHITPEPVCQGTLTGQCMDLYYHGTAVRARVRYSGGSIGLELNDGSG